MSEVIRTKNNSNKVRAAIIASAKIGPMIAAKMTETSAKRRAPIKSGELRDSIEAIDNVVTVGADHGVFVELGTATTPAQPFFIPAVEEVAPKFVGICNDELSRRL